MNKLQNKTLNKFLYKFVEELKEENEDRKENVKLNIPFIISTLYQSFYEREKENDDKYKSFILDLEEFPDYEISIRKSSNDYNGIIDVLINLYKYNKPYGDYRTTNYSYIFCFSYDERNYGYCYCTPDMKDYREDKKCCGHGCDADFCEFSLNKILKIVGGSWNGDEHDYWEFEDKFYEIDKELADKKVEEDKERMIRELKNNIESDRKKLCELGVDDFDFNKQ